MRYWDTSGLVPLFVREGASPLADSYYRDDPRVITWTLSEVELLSALARRRREGAFSEEAFASCRAKVTRFWAAVVSVHDVARAKARAQRLLLTHPLRAADALQLAAALLAVSEAPAGHSFVCFDERLANAAAIEGFDVLTHETAKRP
jgi:predicted nucleic acid-binding protein